MYQILTPEDLEKAPQAIWLTNDGEIWGNLNLIDEDLPAERLFTLAEAVAYLENNGAE